MAKRARTSIKRHSLNVWNQEDQPICLAIVMADMLTIIYRMLGYTNLVLSPQILIDLGCKNWYGARKVVTNLGMGLQSIRDYPFVFTKTLYNKIKYQQGIRYCLDKVKMIANDLSQIKRAIQDNFSEKGKNYPLGIGIKMGDFHDAAVALAACKKPFRHPLGDRNYSDKLNAEVSHAMLIVGADFSSKDEREHFCVVKNSYGVQWGDKGFSNIFVDMLKVLFVPVLLEEKIFHVGWKEDETHGISPDNKKRRIN